MPCTSYVLAAPFFADRVLSLCLRFMRVRSDGGDTTAEGTVGESYMSRLISVSIQRNMGHTSVSSVSDVADAQS